MPSSHNHEWVKINQTKELIFLRRDVIAWVWEPEAMTHRGPWRACPTCTVIEPLYEEKVDG